MTAAGFFQTEVEHVRLASPSISKQNKSVPNQSSTSILNLGPGVDQRPQPHVIFLHGLNTFGDDELHIGPLRFGKMDRELSKEFARHGVGLQTVNRVGQGSPEEQAEIVFTWLKTQVAEKKLSQDRPLVLLGNSLGGLVARVVAHRMPNSMLAPWSIPLVVTWGTPHRGVVAAGVANEFSRRYPTLFRTTRYLAKLANYDLTQKEQTFRHYTPQAMDTFNLRFPALNGKTREVSLLCRVPIQHVAPCFWPLYPKFHDLGYGGMFYRLVTENESHSPSDGFVPVGSQLWGDVIGDFRLDHFTQLGFVELLPRRSSREIARSEFRDLVSNMVFLIRELK